MNHISQPWTWCVLMVVPFVVTEECWGALTDNVRCFLEFDENTGNSAADASGNGKQGTLELGAGWDTGKLGSAVEFSDNSDDRVQLATNIGHNGVAEFSILMWIYAADAGDNYDTIFSQSISTNDRIELSRGGPGFGTTANLISVVNKTGTGGGQIYGYNASGGSNISISSTTWYHIAMVFNGAGGTTATRLMLYVNGVLQSLTPTDTSISLSPDIGGTNPYLGGSTAFANRRFTGRIDQFVLLDRAITQPEITAIFNANAGISYSSWTGAAAHYHRQQSSIRRRDREKFVAAIGLGESRNLTPNGYTFATTRKSIGAR